MIKVQIDGDSLSSDISNIKTMGELVELIKATIDPDTIITSLNIEGRDLSDADWRAPLSVQGESMLEVTTGGKTDYLASRYTQAPELLSYILEEFAHTRVVFQEGNSMDGNSALALAVQDLRAFLDWYNSLLAMDSDLAQEHIDSFNDSVVEISGVCEQVMQHQLYQSWWALCEMLEKKLEPTLVTLKELCEKIGA